MLRHYHEIGLLEPAEVDVDSGYRRYAAEQIVTAQIIRRFRDLEMPLEDIHIVLEAPDVDTRNRVIANHLARLESVLARTQETVASVRGCWIAPRTVASRSITAMSQPRPPPSSRTLLKNPTLSPGIGEPWAKWLPR